MLITYNLAPKTVPGHWVKMGSTSIRHPFLLTPFFKINTAIIKSLTGRLDFLAYTWTEVELALVVFVETFYRWTNRSIFGRKNTTHRKKMEIEKSSTSYSMWWPREYNFLVKWEYHQRYIGRKKGKKIEETDSYINSLRLFL